jgi:hypothetical protein
LLAEDFDFAEAFAPILDVLVFVLVLPLEGFVGAIATYVCGVECW